MPISPASPRPDPRVGRRARLLAPPWRPCSIGRRACLGASRASDRNRSCGKRAMAILPCLTNSTACRERCGFGRRVAAARRRQAILSGQNPPLRPNVARFGKSRRARVKTLAIATETLNNTQHLEGFVLSEEAATGTCPACGGRFHSGPLLGLAGACAPEQGRAEPPTKLLLTFCASQGRRLSA